MERSSLSCVVGMARVVISFVFADGYGKDEPGRWVHRRRHVDGQAGRQADDRMPVEGSI